MSIDLSTHGITANTETRSPFVTSVIPDGPCPQPPTNASFTETAEMGFKDVLGIVNPLQHIPVVGTLYRAITGDVPSPPARVIGAALYGGPVGAAAAVANAIIEQTSGKTVEGHLFAALGIDNGQDTGVAAAPSPTAPSPAGNGPSESDLADRLIAFHQSRPAGLPAAAHRALAWKPGDDAVQVADATPAPARPTLAAVPASNPAASTNPEAAAPAKDAGAPVATAPAAKTGDLKAKTAAAPVWPTGGATPSRMPARDTLPASTLQARQVAAQRNQTFQRPVSPVTAFTNSPVTPEQLSETMLRNLEKYQAAKRAAGPTGAIARTAS